MTGVVVLVSILEDARGSAFAGVFPAASGGSGGRGRLGGGSGVGSGGGDLGAAWISSGKRLFSHARDLPPKDDI